MPSKKCMPTGLFPSTRFMPSEEGHSPLVFVDVTLVSRHCEVKAQVSI